MSQTAPAVALGWLIHSLDQLPSAAEAGFDYAETVPTALGVGQSAAQRARAAGRVAGGPVPVRTLCAFLPPPGQKDLMVVGPSVDHDRLRAYLLELFEAMSVCGAALIGFGSGAARTPPDGFPRERALQQLKDFLALSGDLALRRGVRVALEPYNRRDTGLVHTVAEGAGLVARLGHPGVGLMADFFHMRLNGEHLDTIAPAGPHLIHAHIAEPGRGLAPTAEADHAAFLQVLVAAGYRGGVTVTGRLEAYPTPAATVAALRRQLAQAVAAPPGATQ